MYLFLLNNSYFIAQMSQPPGLLNLELRSGINCRGLQMGALLCHPERDKYIDSYLDVSWGHVLSSISQSKISGLLHRWVNTSSRNSLAEFKSALHKTYQAQKLWKVPDPQLRDALRKSIAERVITAYRNYLKEHPELEKYIGDEASNPEVLEEMLGEIFEG
uniref:Exocyst subunit Exo70 family protein n=2 Tax=Triticum urartu TaxID=4572 RepID=A0A8R7PLE2_TRIUA